MITPLIPGVALIESNVDVHATSKALPQYDFTLSVDSLGDEGDGGTVSAEITRKGMSAYEQENLEAGTHSFYRDSDITITAVPNAGYRVQDWTINGQTTADTATSKTLSNLQGEYDGSGSLCQAGDRHYLRSDGREQRRRLYQRGKSGKQ